MDNLSNAVILTNALKQAGVDCVFGLPGTQNIALYEALRTSGLRSVVATSELSAAMMANGYFRASGRPGVLLTIPGPGFAWALPGIAEAALDSTAILHITGAPATAPGNRFQLQAFDQPAVAKPLYKAVHAVSHADGLADAVALALADALRGEPGPVLLQVAQQLSGEPSETSTQLPTAPAEPDARVVAEIAHALDGAARCVLLLGQGCQGASGPAMKLAECLGAAVVTTTSGRGAVPEDHPLSLGFEFGGYGSDTLNALIASCDRVVAVGCKFSHNGSRGFRLRIPQDKLIHVDASAETPGANYPARTALCADAPQFLSVLLERLRTPRHGRGFEADQIASWRERANAEKNGQGAEPRILGVADSQPRSFFRELRQAMPRESILVTDSGQHQELARRHFPVWCARGLITPTNLQSMGFGIGAAIGAKLASSHRPVVALIGDGGLAMSGLELLTAVRESLNLVVIVFVDGVYGAIRNQQRIAYGHASGTALPELDCEALAAAIGAQHHRLLGDPQVTFTKVLEHQGVAIIEVAVGDSWPMRWTRAKGMARKLLGRSG